MHACAPADLDESTHSAEQFEDTDRVVNRQVTSADELAEALRPWRFEFLQLERGRFQGAIACLNFDRVMICSGSSNRSLLQRYTTPPECVTLLRPRLKPGTLLHRGRPLAPGECLIGGPEVSGEAVNREAHCPLAMSIRLDAWPGPPRCLAPSSLSPGNGMTLIAPGPRWVSHFLGGVAWLMYAVLNHPEMMQQAASRGRMEEFLLAQLGDLMDECTAPMTERSARARRRAAVERARAYIHQNLTDPITLSDLCRHVHMQSRSLEYGFQEVLGLTPMSYVKLLRMHRVRQLLRSGVRPTRSVSQIALDCGFWHLSQFAVDYKKHFGESPSATCRGSFR